MILTDSSVWIDHLRSTDPILFAALDAGRVLGHPFVAGEVALGILPRRAATLAFLQRLPQAPVATADEVMRLIDRQRLYGRGIGWTDAHLLASVLLAGDARLWTRDKRLAGTATELGIGWSEGKD